MRHHIDKIIEDLYAGALDAPAWDRALLRIADWIRSSGAFLFSVNPTTGVALRDEIHRLDVETGQAYRRDWIDRDIRIAAGLRMPIGEPMFERKLELQENWEQSAIFNDFLLPHDTPYMLAAWLYKTPFKVVALSFQGSRRRGPFDEQEARRLKKVVPHLRRALEIRDRLEAHQIRANTLSSAIEGLQLGLFVLDDRGCILDASGNAEELLRRETAVRREKDRTLWLRDPAGSQFRNLLRAGIYTGHSSGLLSIPRGNARQPLSALVAPMPSIPVTWTGTDPRWLVMISDPECRAAPSAETISHDLDISERESQIAALLAMGYSMPRIAQRLGISVHTARSHLKHIFNKTDIRSQNDLIRRILTSPAAYAAHRKV